MTEWEAKLSDEDRAMLNSFQRGCADKTREELIEEASRYALYHLQLTRVLIEKEREIERLTDISERRIRDIVRKYMALESLGYEEGIAA